MNNSFKFKILLQKYFVGYITLDDLRKEVKTFDNYEEMLLDTLCESIEVAKEKLKEEF